MTDMEDGRRMHAPLHDPKAPDPCWTLQLVYPACCSEAEHLTPQPSRPGPSWGHPCRCPLSTPIPWARGLSFLFLFTLPLAARENHYNTASLGLLPREAAEWAGWRTRSQTHSAPVVFLPWASAGHTARPSPLCTVRTIAPTAWPSHMLGPGPNPFQSSYRHSSDTRAQTHTLCSVQVTFHWSLFKSQSEHLLLRGSLPHRSARPGGPGLSYLPRSLTSTHTQSQPVIRPHCESLSPLEYKLDDKQPFSISAHHWKLSLGMVCGPRDPVQKDVETMSEWMCRTPKEQDKAHEPELQRKDHFSKLENQKQSLETSRFYISRQICEQKAICSGQRENPTRFQTETYRYLQRW